MSVEGPRPLRLSLSKPFVLGGTVVTGIVAVAILASSGWPVASATVGFVSGAGFPYAVRGLKTRSVRRGNATHAGQTRMALLALAPMLVALAVATSLGTFLVAGSAWNFGFWSASFAFQFTTAADRQRQAAARSAGAQCGPRRTG